MAQSKKTQLEDEMNKEKLDEFEAEFLISSPIEESKKEVNEIPCVEVSKKSKILSENIKSSKFLASRQKSDVLKTGNSSSGWGGRRERAGRKPSLRETKTKRVPVDLIEHIDYLIETTNKFYTIDDDGIRKMDILLPQEKPSTLKLPLSLEKIPAGFPSPAESYIDDYIDLNEYLITNPPATFLVRAGGNSMLDAGISYGDILVVDRSLNVKNGDIVMADVGSRYTIKRLRIDKKQMRLCSENKSGHYPDFVPIEGDEWVVVGVVTSVIKKFR